jgi:segregation and condensation protein A
MTQPSTPISDVPSSPAPDAPIAADGYRVQLDTYYGPMDLLLHLIQIHEVDIFHIPITSIADQYVAYLQLLKEHDINLSGEFAALAAHLLLLKSRALVPSDEPVETEEDQQAPRLELVRKLIEYRRYKDLAIRLESLAVERARSFARPRIAWESTEEEPVELEVEVWDLLKSFAQMVQKTTLRASLTILYRDIPIEKFVERIQALLASRRQARFSEVVGPSPERPVVIGSFLAVLEMMKQQQVRVYQPQTGADFLIERS